MKIRQCQNLRISRRHYELQIQYVETYTLKLEIVAEKRKLDLAQEIEEGKPLPKRARRSSLTKK